MAAKKKLTKKQAEDKIYAMEIKEHKTKNPSKLVDDEKKEHSKKSKKRK
jgi:hypothetical protein